MTRLLPSYAIFSMWLITFTFLLGFLGMLSAQIVSLFALLPYLLAFYLMTVRFVKVNKILPTVTQRWQLSLGCTTIFWLYSILAGIIGLLMTQGHIDFGALKQAFSNIIFVIIFLGIFFILNAFLVVLGYWFLGNPTAKMLAHYHKP
ncbi:MAG: ABZJ_00895 family protein [Acinetobacter populi]|uniref:ABZJ_00895 family protein n=1 Tax=Acinetobacter populi TaxID=1582270 RepID=UPI0023566C31|nr:ABZJ_00895 family protein [Acinetobacter populi]MCH4247056.1 ABZJ_00895 family protein [Acinetobacter populi]